MNPERGGVAKLPAPHPMKNREETRPVTFTFLATQEKQEPNCQETKKPTRTIFTNVVVFKDFT